tara:strand:+ start:129 stop:329 length:201 start_codon:yes stop_codon:yes gene_type:complete
MNAKTILDKIFNNICVLMPRETNKKYVDSSTNKELYKIQCVGYIDKDDINDLSNLKHMNEIHFIKK